MASVLPRPPCHAQRQRSALRMYHVTVPYSQMRIHRGIHTMIYNEPKAESDSWLADVDKR